MQVDDLLVDGDRVAAASPSRVMTGPHFWACPSGVTSHRGLQVDFLRIIDGQIVEVQAAGDLPALVEPLDARRWRLFLPPHTGSVSFV